MRQAELMSLVNAEYEKNPAHASLDGAFDRITGLPITDAPCASAGAIVKRVADSFDPLASDAEQLRTAAAVLDSLARAGESIAGEDELPSRLAAASGRVSELAAGDIRGALARLRIRIEESSVHIPADRLDGLFTDLLSLASLAPVWEERIGRPPATLDEALAACNLTARRDGTGDITALTSPDIAGAGLEALRVITLSVQSGSYMITSGPEGRRERWDFTTGGLGINSIPTPKKTNRAIRPGGPPQFVGWQITNRDTDSPPDGHTTYEVRTLDDVLAWLASADDRHLWRLLPACEGDIEEPVFVSPPPRPPVLADRGGHELPREEVERIAVANMLASTGHEEMCVRHLETLSDYELIEWGTDEHGLFPPTTPWVFDEVTQHFFRLKAGVLQVAPPLGGGDGPDEARLEEEPEIELIPGSGNGAVETLHRIKTDLHYRGVGRNLALEIRRAIHNAELLNAARVQDYFYELCGEDERLAAATRRALSEIEGVTDLDTPFVCPDCKKAYHVRDDMLYCCRD
jgi:hypothetical protein